MSVWRHITHPDGMTVSLLVTATGLSKEQVRAELRALEKDGKACRERAAPQLGANSERRATVTTEDLLLEFMARVNNALSLEDDALRLRAVRKAKHWAEDEYEKLHGCSAGLIDVEEQS